SFVASIPLSLTVEDGPAGPASRMRIRPLRPLSAHVHHSLIIGASLRDRGGAPLVDDIGERRAWSRDFTTAGVGSGGPEPALRWPRPGQEAVPTNLAAVELTVFPPVPLPQPEAAITLEAEDGGLTALLLGPEPCPGWVPGTCLRMRPSAVLRPGVRYRPAGGTLIDRAGRRSTLPSLEGETWFWTGDGPDDAPPDATVSAVLRGRCLVATIIGEETLAATLSVDGRARTAVLPAGWGSVGVAVEPRPAGEAVSWSLQLVDLAANLGEHAGSLEADAGLDPTLPRLAITEVLANPAGPEPDAEFVELWLDPAASQPAELAGLILSDRDFTELLAAWEAGDDLPGDPLPTATMQPGQRALVVASGWAPALGDDPPPPSDTPILVVDASLGSGGLKNAGEPLSLWIAGDEGPVLVAGYGDWIDTGASAFSGRSVVGEGDGCDLADRWRPHPQGRSGPGLAP
ncbi:MAG: hypothetical protein KC431_09760, partial [Myxococcales bacterium]|nr:hypothetical protein [Myxococcales bacterium]